MKILCCECGVLIDPNPSNTCITCLRRKIDISEDIRKNLSIYYCKFCQRFLNPPDTWAHYDLGSMELLTMCLKKISTFNKVKLVDAKFLWTEPHSYSLIIQVTIQKEVMGVILEQAFNVDVKIHKQMCKECHRVEANDFYRAIVQVRQRTRHKKTLYYLEQVILKHKANEDCCKIEIEKDGINFYFRVLQQANKFVDFLHNYVPCCHEESKELLSHDTHNNVYNYKYTTLVTITPICKDDVVCLPKKLAKSMGLSSSVLVCYNVTNSIHLVDAYSLQSVHMSAKDYNRQPFLSVCSFSQLSIYMVLEVDEIKQPFFTHPKYKLCEVTVMRLDAKTAEDVPITVKSHLGNALKPGCYVYGFNLKHANVNNEDFEALDLLEIPDAILVKRYYGNKSERRTMRRWKLRRLQETEARSTKETNESDNLDDFEDFLNDIEEDSDNRKNINIFKDERAKNLPQITTNEEHPEIPLHEMLEELEIT